MNYTLLSKSNAKFWLPLTSNDEFTKITVRDILENTDIEDWEAIKEPNRRFDLDKKVPESYYIRRSDDSDILSPYVRGSYEVYQYTEGLRWLQYFLDEDLLSIDTVLLLGHGKEFAITCDINVEAEVVEGDKLTRFLTFCLSHTGSARGLFYTDFRMVCENTLRLGKSMAIDEVGKSFVLDDANPRAGLKAAKDLISLNERTFTSSAVKHYQQLHDLELTYRQVDNLVRDLLDLPEEVDLEESTYDKRVKKQYRLLMDNIESSPGNELLRSGYNGYKFLNGVTYTAKTLGKEGLSQYRNNIKGTGNRWRNRTLKNLQDLLPKT